MITEKERNKAVKEKLGLWREEARRHSEKNLKRDSTVGSHQFGKLEVRGSLNSLQGLYKYMCSEGFMFFFLVFIVFFN